MNKIFAKASVVLMAIFLVACGEQTFDFDSLGENEFESSETKGEIGSFSLLTPIDNASTVELPTFTWEEAENATNYTLEVASTTTFEKGTDLIPLLDTELYLKKQGIATTSFDLSASIRIKDRSYYWRVTAYNDDHSKACNQAYGSFYLAANANEEIPFEIGDIEDWTTHPKGSQADISINNTNFFGNNKESLAIEFTMEQTKTGNVESDGWIVVTKSAEMELYGTDSLYFNFYYMGHDADIFVRFLDSDNEYWHCEIQVARNSKQTVILDFDDFQLRTRESYIGDRVFGYQNIKYFEVVFEQSYGDGVCLFSDVKAIRYERYAHMFVDTIDFNDYEKSTWTNEAYDFNPTIGDEGHSLTLNYDASANDYNTKGIGTAGYGFVRIPINRYFTKGDAIKLDVKYTGYATANMILRIYEQDTDRWSYTHPFSNLVAGEYKTIIIPYGAFEESQIMGDGTKQFYYILNMQFGLNKIYGSGTLSFSNFEIVSLDNEIDDEERIANVGMDGVIENFDSYETSNELYYKWILSSANKDEYIALEKDYKTGGSANKAAGKITYKSDMSMATYTVPTSVTTEGTNALSIWIKDGTLKSDNAAFNYLDDAHPQMTIQLRLETGEEYRYTISALKGAWYEYNIPYSLFTINNPELFFEGPAPITGEAISHFSIGIQYFYKLENGTSYPVYTQRNPVYLDNIKLTTASSYGETVKEKVLIPDSEDAKLCYIDDFEDYQNDNELSEMWSDGVGYPYSEMTISNNTAGQINNEQSMRLKYQGNSTSVNYFLATNFADDVDARGMKISLLGDNKATVYINIYMEMSGTIVQFRHTMTNLANVWKEYAIGFDNFANLSSSSSVLITRNNVKLIKKITFGIVNNVDANISHVYVDNMIFDGNMTYSHLSSTTL